MQKDLDIEAINMENDIETLSSYHDYVHHYFKWDTIGDHLENKFHATIGIVEEVSELMDEHEIDAFSESVLDESGDVLFYLMLHRLSTSTKEKTMEWFRDVLFNTHHINPNINVLKVAVKSLGCMKKIHFKKSQKPILHQTIDDNLKTIAIWLCHVGFSKYTLIDVIGKNIEKLNIRHK